MKHLIKRLALMMVLPSIVFAQSPGTVEETWKQFDPRAEPLEVEVIRESGEAGIELRHVRYVVGTFDGKKTRDGGEFAARPRPYLKQGAAEIDADAAFREQFENAVDQSVRREAEDR